MISFIEFLAEELTLVPGTQYGSNSGGIHTDDTGKKYYVKHYKNADQAKVEALTGKIYNHMGIKTLNPEYQEVRGKPSISTPWNDKLHSVEPKEFDKLSPKQADQVGRMYHGAILTKNWDIVGLEHDNIMKHDNGDLHAIDHGGSLQFRAQGGHKDFGPDIGEHESLRTNSGASGHVFSSAFKQYPQAEHNGVDAVRKMDDNHIHSLFQNSGLSNWKDLHKNFMARKQTLLDKYS